MSEEAANPRPDAGPDPTGSEPVYNTWELSGVLVREEYLMPWAALSEVPGLDSAESAGVQAKYFGKTPESGPFAYLFRYEPGGHLGPRRHRANLMLFVLSGGADLDGRPIGAGWYAYVPAGRRLPPLVAGDCESRMLEIFDGPPGLESVSR